MQRIQIQPTVNPLPRSAAPPRRRGASGRCSAAAWLALSQAIACGAGGGSADGAPDLPGGAPIIGGPGSDFLPGDPGSGAPGSGPTFDPGELGGLTGGEDVVEAPLCRGNCPDFPAAPIIVEGTAVGPNPASAFAAPGGSGVCVLEPPPGALMPANWSPPLFQWEGNDSLWEITVSSPQQANDLRVYTHRRLWSMPREMWEPFALNNDDSDVTVTIRGASGVSAQSTFHVAPVRATGSMVYWALQALDSTQIDNSWLEGFFVGDVNTTQALKPSEVQLQDRVREGYEPQNGGGRVVCIGCHTSTPGGDEIAFTDTWPWSNAVVSIEEGQAGARPDYYSAPAEWLQRMPWQGVQTFSQAHWSEGDRMVITSMGHNDQLPRYEPYEIVFQVDQNGNLRRPDISNVNFPWSGKSGSDQPNAELAWFDLEASEPATATVTNEQGQVDDQLTRVQPLTVLGQSWGYLRRDGDSRGAMAPDWSTDGETVVYVSTHCGKDGRLSCGDEGGNMPSDREADLYTVPYGDRTGGIATPVAGASESNVWEYYPAYSPDDRFIAYNRVAAYGSTDRMYYNPDAEIYVVPAAGGTATRLAANDPVACDPRGIRSPGVYNSWAKWSPRSVTLGDKTYYFLIFSSARNPDVLIDPNVEVSKRAPRAQLYMTALVVDQAGTVSTYPAVHIWAQNPDTSNHTPAWDTFPIPPPVDTPRIR